MEDLPKPLLCLPLVAQWAWLAARHRSPTLPSSVNPSIETGGLAGESKSACLAQISTAFAPWVAAWRRVGPGESALVCRREADLAFPLIAKPDIGWCGYGVRRIESAQALAEYAAEFPRRGAILLQALVTDPAEAGLFYVRQPGARHGRLEAMTRRHAPCVVGDGLRRVSALIADDLRLRPHTARYAATLGRAGMARIPHIEERVTLTAIASLRIGARYEDATARITDRLTARIDAIARSMPDFHFGRFDVRFATVAALQAGDFTIIEVNGAGSEAIHNWDPALSLRAGFAGVFAKQRMLFEMGAQMRARGHKPVGVVALARAWLKQQALIGRYPESN